MRETEHEITFETLIFYRIDWALSSSEYPTIVADFQIYSVQFTGKCVCEPPFHPPSPLGMI